MPERLNDQKVFGYNLVGLNCRGWTFVGVFLIQYLNASNLDPFNSREKN